MKGIALLFFVSATIYLLGGLVLGIYMGIIHDHTLATAHAHLNLVGFMVFSVMGLFYHATPAAAATLGARLHFGLATLGVFLLVPGIGLTVQGDETGEPLAIAGSLATTAGVATFLINLAVVKTRSVRTLRDSPASA